jgi:hypothetical protein
MKHRPPLQKKHTTPPPIVIDAFFYVRVSLDLKSWSRWSQSAYFSNQVMDLAWDQGRDQARTSMVPTLLSWSRPVVVPQPCRRGQPCCHGPALSSCPTLLSWSRPAVVAQPCCHGPHPFISWLSAPNRGCPSDLSRAGEWTQPLCTSLGENGTALDSRAMS